MPASIRPLFRRRASRLVALAITALAATGPAGAQQPRPPEAPAPRENPGLVNEIGKLLKDPSLLLPDFAKPDSGKTDTPVPDAPPAPQPTADPPPVSPPQRQPAVPATPAPSPPASPPASPTIPAMINGRQVCPASANGAPDCAAGAAILCRSKGYQDGRSLAVDATEKCSAKLLIPGRARQPGDCRTENFVTRAWCQ
ncbi:hypothetical protein SR870_16105 [Rhodopseudomonas palustris]|uniref:hypothetical protein n=1 Tax=Rhodopseudomonas palustris TaxID=1076 RepID=UPI002ACE2785|nr:hypothetical protein [Rhodopseudomonas palustris]WQG98219.1 hypothetical protein SR870_16105 [Rhodopseudomonas palustris]